MQSLSIETLSEIYHSVRANKIRAVLSGFGVAWGILILVVLLGIGQGFQHSVMDIFSAFAQKSIYVYGGTTSMQHGNISEGRQVRFDRRFLQRLQHRYPEIEVISPRVSSHLQIQSGTRSGVFNLSGVEADYMQIRILRVREGGRLFNRADIARERNVAIIGENVANILFGHTEALGKDIQISGLLYKVIGVLRNDDLFGAQEINSVFIPFSTYIRNVNSQSEFTVFGLRLAQDTDSRKFEENLRNYIANQLQFSVNDRQAVFIANFETQTSAFESLFKGLRQIIWVFGFCFLVSGVAGICNTMFMIVKERTNEIGIRKAIGATPRSIISLVLLESIIITAIAGLTGLFAGKGILMFINWLITMSENEILIEQTLFDYRTALGALIVLIISGIIAGALPAIKASTIQPIDAIRYGNIG